MAWDLHHGHRSHNMEHFNLPRMILSLLILTSYACVGQAVQQAHANGTDRRHVDKLPNGTYAVAEYTPQRIKRMEGHFLDSTLTIPHGPFAFYHPNGRIESCGMYHHGVKVGQWVAQDSRGVRKADRHYTGLSGEELLLSVGVISKAAPLSEEH